eukprot:8883015-Pyramimonas_sp.AAC.1
MRASLCSMLSSKNSCRVGLRPPMRVTSLPARACSEDDAASADINYTKVEVTDGENEGRGGECLARGGEEERRTCS